MKKIFSVLCVLIVLSCVLSLLFSGVGAADVSHNKKIVSVVYDDSGSMRTSNRYVYANYAMQTFCSLLGAEDELHITYMNDYSNPRKMDLSDNRIQSSVDQIRNRLDPNGTTPYESVIKAMEILRNKNDTNEKTEYILVVITDGAFSGYPGEGKANSFSAFSDERMANGTKPNIIYLGIGSGINELNLNKSNIKEFYACDDANDKVNGIVGKMSEIANVVSGRSQVNSADIKAVNSTTVEIKSDVPLSNIAALVQSGGKITSVKHKETGKTLTVGRNVSSSCKVGNISLSSQSFLIEAKNENIPAGTYVLTFDQAVAIENLVVMYEPALELRLTIRCNGRELDKLTELDLLHQKDLITVSYDIYEYGTDKIVSLSSLPAGTTASLTVYENGTQKKTVNGSENTIRDYSLNLAKTEFKAVLQLPNFNPIEAFIDFTPLKYVNYTVGAEYGGGTDSVMLKDISGQHNLSIVFTLYADGVPVTDPAAVNNFAPKVTASPDGNQGTMTVKSNGQIVFVPNAASSSGFVNGALTVTAVCEINGVSASKTYTVKEPVYTVKAEYGSATSSVKLTDISKTHDLSIIFTVYEDGVQIKDKAKIESLGYQVTPTNGHKGTTVISADGKISYVPNQASGAGNVTVTCTVAGKTASKSYDVIAPVYTIQSAYGSATDGIKITDIANPHDLSIVFTVYEDGVQIKDKAKLEAIGAQVSASPAGHSGKTEIKADGTIVFTPNQANEAGTVTVDCTAGGATASKTYTVFSPSYTVKAEYGSSVNSVKLTDITKPHGLSIVFTIYEGGNRLSDKASVEALGYRISVSDGHNGDITLTDDGKIIFTPNAASGAGTVTVTCEAENQSSSVNYTVIAPVYQINAEHGSDIREIHFDNINSNHGVSIIFKVYEDGVLITDKSVLETIANTSIKASEAGSEGSIVCTDDGKIIYTPNAAWGKTGTAFYDVTVTCSIDGASASQSYRINLPAIIIETVKPDSPIAKNEFFGNTKSIAFYVVKDGKRLSKADIQTYAAEIVNENYKNLKLAVEIRDDGMVICTPYDENEHIITFWNWWVNYVYYWKLPGQDMTIHFISDYGSVDGVIPVGAAPIRYLIWNVWVPFVIVLAIALFLAWWIFCIITKPRFPKNRTIYAGKAYIGDDGNGNYYHMVFNFRKYNLKKYNTWKYILKPTRTPLEKDIAGVRFTATKKGPRCSASWYAVTPVDLNEGTAMDASMIFAKKPSAELEELMDAEGADMKGQVFSRANKEFCYMFVKSKMVDEKGYEHVADATILFYV